MTDTTVIPDNPYKQLEDSVYEFVVALYPDWRIKFAYDNAPELQTPYLVIDIRQWNEIGREYTSSSTSLDVNNKTYVTTVQDYEALVRFEFVGQYDGNLTLAGMAQGLSFDLRTQRGYEAQEVSGLSLMRTNAVRRIPNIRDTDTYMYYQLDAYFGYAITNTDEQDYMVDIGINGVYHNAGREPDHIIETTIEINPDRSVT